MSSELLVEGGHQHQQSDMPVPWQSAGSRPSLKRPWPRAVFQTCQSCPLQAATQAILAVTCRPLGRITITIITANSRSSSSRIWPCMKMKMRRPAWRMMGQMMGACRITSWNMVTHGNMLNSSQHIMRELAWRTLDHMASKRFCLSTCTPSLQALSSSKTDLQSIRDVSAQSTLHIWRILNFSRMTMLSN